MPFIIPRDQAIDEISATLKKGECLVCHLLASRHSIVLNRSKYTTSVLSKYPRTWGQTMILLNVHKTFIGEVSKEEWTELTERCRELSVRIEEELKPLRCYVSSLGATENLPNTCPHIHFNIIPIYHSEDKPSEIFTWEKGVLGARADEWADLYNKLK